MMDEYQKNLYWDAINQVDDFFHCDDHFLSGDEQTVLAYISQFSEELDPEDYSRLQAQARRMIKRYQKLN